MISFFYFSLFCKSYCLKSQHVLNTKKTPIYLSDMILQLEIAIMPTKLNYKVSDPRFGMLHVLY